MERERGRESKKKKREEIYRKNEGKKRH